LGSKDRRPQKGTPITTSTYGAAQADIAAAASANECLQPLDYMLAVMRDPMASEARRDMMTKAAAPGGGPVNLRRAK